MTQDYKQLVQGWFDCIWNKGDVCAVETYLADDCELTGVGPEPVTGPDAFRAFHGAITAAIADVKVSVEDLIQEGDKVAGYFTVTGQHRASATAVRFTSHFFAWCAGGKIIRVANDVDYLGFLTQISAVDPLVMHKAMQSPDN